MKYNLIETNDVIETILKLNNITNEELNKEYDFINKDEVFFNFKEKLIENINDKFLIVGDYDCDGICATTIIKKLLNELGVNSNYIIPSRIKDGYGLNNNIVNMAKENGFDSLFLVDNGIVANEAIDLAYSLGLKVFIIDHHEYLNLPRAEAIIHSNIVDDKYKGLSAGGLAFVLSRLFYEDDLSLVLGGLSTLSDMMSVVGFNRFLIKEMMRILNTKSIYQMNLLNDNNSFDYESLSFNVIPKINALSRMEPMGDANKLVLYFLADEKTCRTTIEQINYVNEKRKQYTKSMYAEAKELINEDSNIIVVSSSNFQEGLCGLISNRLTHEMNKPSIVLTIKDNNYLGSGRSCGSYNLFEALKNFDHFDAYGGHEEAVGLSFSKEYLNDFIDYVNSLTIDNNVNQDVLLINHELITKDLINEINSLKPFGKDFNLYKFAIKNDNYKKMIVSNRFPKYLIRNDFSAISFDIKTKDINPEYFIGNIKQDSYHIGALQLLIEDLI